VEPDLHGIAERAGAAPTPVVLIDGRSGSGKSELAAALAPLLSRAGGRAGPSAAQAQPAQLVRLDDIYPGWGGLEAASAAVVTDILSLHRWRRWDWGTSSPAEWHELDPTRPLIVEGCGALSRASRKLATFAIWVELDEPTRKARALARDGDAYASHWDRWAAQEDVFLAREDPAGLADLVVSG